MNTSGKPTEGWMTVVPATILIFFVVLALGGPEAAANTFSLWASDLASYVARVIKSL